MFIFIVGLVLPVIIGVVYTAISNSLIRRREFQRLKPLASSLAITCVIVSLLIVYTFIGGFGPGAVMALGSLISTCVTLPLAIIIGRAVLRAREEIRSRKGSLALALSVTFLIPVAQLVPLGGAIAISSGCDAWHRSKANAIISASEDYQSSQGRYPSEISELVPDYLRRIPKATCLAPYQLVLGPGEFGYGIEKCGQTTVLHLMVTRAGYGQRYNFATGEWSHYDFLDEDPCYKLK